MVFWIALASSKSWISEIRLLDQSRCENRILWEITQSSAKKTKKRRPTSRRFGSRRSPYLADGPASVATEMVAPETTEVADATSFDSDIAVHGVSIHLSADPAADVDSRDGTTRYESGDPRSSRSGDDDLAPEGEGTTAANGGDGAADDPFSDPVAASTMAKILASAAATRLREVAPDAGVSSPIPSRRRTTKMDRSAFAAAAKFIADALAAKTPAAADLREDVAAIIAAMEREWWYQKGFNDDDDTVDDDDDDGEEIVVVAPAHADATQLEAVSQGDPMNVDSDVDPLSAFESAECPNITIAKKARVNRFIRAYDKRVAGPNAMEIRKHLNSKADDHRLPGKKPPLQ